MVTLYCTLILRYQQALQAHRSNRSLTMLHKADISVLYFAFFWLSFANARGKVIFNLELLVLNGDNTISGLIRANI